MTVASSVAFDAVFALFVAAMLVLVVVVLTWAIRKDRAGRAAWEARHRAAAEHPERCEGPEGRA